MILGLYVYANVLVEVLSLLLVLCPPATKLFGLMVNRDKLESPVPQGIKSFAARLGMRATADIFSMYGLYLSFRFFPLIHNLNVLVVVYLYHLTTNFALSKSHNRLLVIWSRADLALTAVKDTLRERSVSYGICHKLCIGEN